MPIGEFEAKLESCLQDSDGSLVLSLRIPKHENRSVNRIVGQIRTGREKGKERLKIGVSWHREKRSLDANAYFWQLCSQIADKVSAPKEEVYRRFIKEQNVFKIVEIRADAVDTFMTAWSMHGTGWIAEKIDRSQTRGFAVVHAYYGSSVYSTKQMSRLIDSVVSEAKELGIETLDEKELREIVKRHGLQTDKSD